nr:hypothetical protein [Nocardioides sp. 616]
MVVKDELADRQSELIALPVPFDPAGRWIIGSRTASGLDRVGSGTQVVLGDVPNTGCLPSRVGGEAGRAGQEPGGAHRVAPDCACLHHRYVATRPRAGGRDRVSWARIVWLFPLEVAENMLGALGGPQREQLVILVSQGAAPTNSHHARIANLWQDHDRFAAR